MQRITSQRDQHPNNRGPLHSFLRRHQAATWQDAPVDTHPGREDANYSSEATLEARGNFARDFYDQNEEFRNYADTEEKYDGSPSSWDPFTWAEVFDGFADFKENSMGATVARRRTAKRKISFLAMQWNVNGNTATATFPNGALCTVSEVAGGYYAFDLQSELYPDDTERYEDGFRTLQEAQENAEDYWFVNRSARVRSRAARLANRRSARKVTSSLNWVADDRGIYEAQGPDGATYIVGYYSTQLSWLAERAKKDGFDYIEFGFFATEAEAKAVVEEFVNGERTARRKSSSMGWSEDADGQYTAEIPNGIVLVYETDEHGWAYAVRDGEYSNNPDVDYAENFPTSDAAIAAAEREWDGHGITLSRKRAARRRAARRQKRAALNWSDVVGEEDNYSASGPDGIEFLIYPSGGSYSVRWTLDVLNTPQGRLHYPEAFESQALAANMAEQFVNKWDQIKEMLAEGPVDYTDVQDIPWKSARRKTAALQWSEDQPGYFTAEVPGGTLVVQYESVYGWGWFAYQGDPDDGEPAIDFSVNLPNADEAKAEAERSYGNGVDPDSGGGVTARRKTASNILDGYWQWCKQYGYDPEDVDQYANQYAESSVEADFIIDQIFDFDFVDGAADPVDFEEWVNGEGREASREGRRRKARGPRRSSAR